MATSSQSPARLTFGPFEVSPLTGELLKGGVRIRLAGQPFQLLLVLLENPGQPVTREQLRERVWGNDSFVDFEHGLNAAMSKLRRALNDSADHPRYIETLPGHGYRFIGALVTHQPAPLQQPENVVAPNAPPVRKRNGVVWWRLGAVMACLVASFAIGWRLHEPSVVMQAWTFSQITNEPSLSVSSAVSPDNKFVVFASDRSREGELDLYIKQIAAGQPIRLTFDGTGNRTPDFSPDGSKIVFRSDRDGGGVYSMPAFGGQTTLLARGGFDPKFSPDGAQVTYWVGSRGVSVSVPGSSTVWTVPATGAGAPRQAGADLTTARFPIWAPDGKHLLVVGYKSAKAFDPSSLDWWLVGTDGSGTKATGAYKLLAEEHLRRADSPWLPARSFPEGDTGPGCWKADGMVVFPVGLGESQNLWQIRVSPRTGITGGLQRLTTGADTEVNPSCGSGGALSFTNLERNIGIWTLPVDVSRGKPQSNSPGNPGSPQRIPTGLRCEEGPSFSSDGRYCVFTSVQSGRLTVWSRELSSGMEVKVAESPFEQRYPVSNQAGSRVAYSVIEHGKRMLYVSTRGSGVSEKVCEGCLRATDWTRDEKALLVFVGNPYHIDLLELNSHRLTTVLKHPEHQLLYGRFSPDNRWVSFTERIRADRGRILIAPVGGEKPAPQSDWIMVAEAGAEDYANWSPDGKILYYSSGRDGHNCLWGQRIRADSHQPAGEPFAIQHFHGRLSLARGWSAAGGQIGLALAENRGSIWLMSPSGWR